MWITLTTDDLRKRFSAPEMDAMRRAQKAFDDAAAQDVLDDTADLARGYVATWSKNRLASAAHSIPPALKSSVLQIALVEYSQTVAGMLIDPKGLRQKAADRAFERLKDCAAGKFTIEQPTAQETQDGTVSAASPTPPTIYRKDTILSRRDQMGSY